MKAPTPTEIHAHLASQQRRMQSTLLQLVEIETPSDDPGTLGPALDFLEAELEVRGYAPRRFRGEIVYATRRERAPRRPAQLLVGHVDTVCPQ